MQRYRVEPGGQISLEEWDPKDSSAFDGDKAQAKERLKALNKELAALQEILWAEHRHKVLIVLQAMDTGGKDGTIRHVFGGVNPQGVRVVNFKAPSQEELDHDYLWRVHRKVPAKGELAIFNRSHYEDVLVVRVHNLVPAEVWQQRYEHICAFERTLAEEGTTLLKFYLHISFEEQKERLQARLDNPEKWWKFNPADLDERKLWPQYVQAYEDVLNRTSAGWAPWYIVPSDHKWYRNLVVAQTMVDTLKGLNMSFPEPKWDFNEVKIP